MSYSITGATYLILSFAIGLLTFRTFQYWKKEKDTMAKIWLIASISLFLFAVSKTIVGLFFANDLVFLKMSIDAGSFLQAVSYSTLAYFVFYVKFSPRISPWWGALPVFILGLASAITSVITPFNPFVEPSGAINWGIPTHLPPSIILRIILFSVVLVPTIIVLFEQFIKSKNVYARRKALGFMMVFFSAIVIGLFDFVFISLLKLDAIWRDAGFVVLSVVVITTLLSTWGKTIPEKT